MARYGNARHPAQDQPSQPVRGPVVGGNAQTRVVTVYGPDPIAASWIGRLFGMTTLVSPAQSGRFRPGDKGSRDNRQTRLTGPLQQFTGATLVGKPMVSRLGAQGGPGSQPAYPGTGSSTPPSVMNALAGMDLPQILRT
jgi:hypothetical protein